LGRNIRPSDLLKAARRDTRQLHLGAYYITGALPEAVAAHLAAVPAARLETQSILAGTYQGQAQQTLERLEGLIKDAKDLHGAGPWQVLGLRDALDVVANPLDYPVCEPAYKKPVQEELLK
jgi:hypothetical protein